MEVTSCTAQEAQRVLERTGNDVKLAILVAMTGMDVGAACDAGSVPGGFLRRAIEGATV